VTYLDYAYRMRASVEHNSIALLMMADSLRGGEATAENIIGILADHKEGISGLDSFRAGRHTVTFKGGASGELGTSGLIERFAGLGANVGVGFDLELVRHSRDLIPISGREQKQTGYDYVIGDAVLIPTACGNVNGGVSAPVARLADAKLNATGTMCYEYTPSSMTALGGYIAQNQDRLHRMEKLGGDDLQFVTDRLYAYYTNTCAPAECAAVKAHLDGIKSAEMGLDIPATVRTKEEIREDVMTDPSIGVLLEDNESTRNQIAALEAEVGRQFSDNEKALLSLAATDGKILANLSDLQKEQIRQGQLLEQLADPDIQAEMMVNAMIEAQDRLRKQQQATIMYLDSSSYEDLSENDKKVKFARELERIEEDYKAVGTYAYAAQNTLLLIGALTGASPETQRDIQRAFAVINAANEMLKAGRAIDNAINAGMLASTAAVGAYAGGVGAVLSVISLFSGGGQSEMQGLMDYMAARFDIIEDQLNLLLDQSVAIHDKVDALLEGQRVITQIALDNARAIQAGRLEQAVIADSIDKVRQQIEDLGLSIDEDFDTASWERSVFFDAELLRDQEQAIVTAGDALVAWLDPDSDVIQRLNAGDRSPLLLDSVREGKQKVVSLIDRLAGPVFVRPLDVVIAQGNDYSRPPVHSLATMSRKADQVSSATQYYRDFRTPQATYAGLNGDMQEADAQLAAMQATSFPAINATAFAGLANPDALLPILESYLTFVLALEPEARKVIGFSEMPRIAAMIDRLSASKREAQSATFALLAISRRSLEWMSRELERIPPQPGLFANRSSLGDYLFKPDSLASDHLDEAEANLVVKRAAADIETLNWLTANARPYIERGLSSDADSVLGLIAFIKETGNWRLPADHSAFVRLADKADAPWVNLRLLETVNALLNAREAGELYEYTEKELAAFDQVAEKSILTDSDIVILVSLIKSPASLIELADDEKMITYRITSEDAAFDLDPSTEDIARQYGTIDHFVYHSGVLTSKEKGGFLGMERSYYSLPYNCEGAQIKIEPGMEDIYSGPTSFAFPTDTGSGPTWGDLTRLAANAVLECAEAAKRKGMWISHPQPVGTYVGRDYWTIIAGKLPNYSKESFKRDAAMLPEKAKLFERATSRCVFKAEWSTQLAGISGVDTGNSIATLANFVERTLDSPYAFESQKVVDDITKEQFTADKQPYDQFKRRVDCELFGEKLSREIFPDLPKLNGPRPAQLVGEEWHWVKGGEVALVANFQNGLIAALQKRRAAINEEVLVEAGKTFREPADGLQDIITELSFAGVDREDQVKVVDAFRAGGRAAMLNHPIVVDFAATHPEEYDQILRRDAFYRSRQHQIALLQTFAEWGLGECLFTVPEYQPLAALFWEPVGTHKMTVPGAVRALQNPAPTATGQYPYAAATIEEGQARLEARIAELNDFPPKPELPYGIYYDRFEDAATDAAAALEVAEANGCHPGHDTIIALEHLLSLMRDQGLVPAVVVEKS
jgi:hypothetical protein